MKQDEKHFQTSIYVIPGLFFVIGSYSLLIVFRVNYYTPFCRVDLWISFFNTREKKSWLSRSLTGRECASVHTKNHHALAMTATSACQFPEHHFSFHSLTISYVADSICGATRKNETLVIQDSKYIHILYLRRGKVFSLPNIRSRLNRVTKNQFHIETH
jgi:hypothetical protein